MKRDTGIITSACLHIIPTVFVVWREPFSMLNGYSFSPVAKVLQVTQTLQSVCSTSLEIANYMYFACSIYSVKKIDCVDCNNTL